MLAITTPRPPSSWRRFTVLPAALLFTCCAALSTPAGAATEPALEQQSWRESLWATWNSLHHDAYALDSVGRTLAEGRRPDCRGQSLVRYAGEELRYHGAVYVNPSFRQRLERFERVVAEVAREVYGRAPTRLRHAGAFSCRTTRQRGYRLSEHALGNAIDVTGFDFGSAARRDAVPGELPKVLRKPFQVRVSRHWQAPDDNPMASWHATFLRTLATRLEQSDDIFRVMIGPSHRDHADHFHFDMSPWRYINF
jgi:hypothetical protein